MKKLLTLFYLLALATASNATSIVYDFEDSDNPFTDNSRIVSDIEYDETLASNVLGWTCKGNAQNGYSFSYFDFSDQLNHPEKVTVEFDYYNKSGGRSILTIGDASVRGTTGGSSKTTYNKTGAIFRIGSDKNNAFINDTQYGQGNLCDKWLHIVVTANIDAKTVEWVVTDKESTEISSGSDAFYADDALSCTQIDVFGYINNSHCSMMDNLTITEYKGDAQYATYTIKYVDAYDNELKPSRSDEGKVGSYVTLYESDKASFYNDDRSMKYIYTSDNTATEVIAAEGTVIKVVFREAEIWNGKLVCMIKGKSGEEGTLAELVTTFFEGDEQTVYPVHGYEKDGKYYFTPATAYNGAPYTFPGSLSPTVIDGKTFFIGYLYYEEDASVAYYSDFERLALPVEDEGEGTGLGQLFGTVNNWWSFSGGYFSRFSGGRAIRLNSDSYVWTEPIAKDGNYRVIIYGRNDKSSVANKPYELGLRDSEGNITMLDDLTIPAWESATTGQIVVEDVNIPAGFSLVIKNPGETEMISLDDIKLVKTDGVPAFPDGTCYMMNAYTGKLVAAGGLDLEGAPITFAFDANAGYTITGSDLFAGKTWIAEGDGYYTFYTLVDGVKKYAAVDGDNFVLIEDGTAESAYWILLNPGYWEATLSYNVAGTADLCGTAWDTNANKMVKNAETGLYEWTAENITVSSEIVPAFKIAVNSTNDMGSVETVAWYPASENWFITTGVTGGEGVFDITITFNNVTKEIGVTAVKAGEEEPSYYLIGSMTSWSINEEYKLTLNEKAPEGIEEYMIVVDLAADAQFKVVKDNGEDKTWYPDGMGNNFGENGEIPAAGTYTVYFRPNGDGGSDWFYNVIYINPYVPQAYELYVAGVQVTDLNAKDILGDGGTFTYNTKKKTLTINGSYTYDNMFLIMNAGIEDLTIYVANDVELSPNDPNFTFYFFKPTTITGPGKLTLNGNIAIVWGAQLTIEGANLELPQTNSYAIMGNLEGESLLIRNSIIHANSYYQAIDNFDGGITIEEGMLEEGLRISDDGKYICKDNGSNASEVFIYDLEYVTGIDRLSPTSSFSERGIYNLAGQRLNKMQKGINIVGGKKVIRK